ncbi:MAG: hypothetical protein OEY38_09650 [Gammaproteobacteria bacterium]|nr:hypothetical protein [Gammaproteobacteria bacterium]
MHFLIKKPARQWLIGLFVLLGLSAMLLRWWYFTPERLVNPDPIWEITLVGKFQATKNKSQISSPLPKSNRYAKVISQRLYHPGFRVLSSKKRKPGHTLVQASQSGVLDFLIQYHVQLRQTPVLQTPRLASLSTVLREKYLASDAQIDLESTTLQSLNQLLQASINTPQDLIAEFFKFSQQTTPRQLELVFGQQTPTSLARAKLFVGLARLNYIPARLVTGLLLTENASQAPYTWVQIHTPDHGWQAFDPTQGFQHSVPSYFLPFSYDTTDLFTIDVGHIEWHQYSTSLDQIDLDIALLERDKNPIDIFNLQRLDLETKKVLTLLLILPVCVLLTAFLRQVLGFYPYGTFTSPLLALAMVYAEISVTLILLISIVFLAVLGRSLLPNTMARAPRLSLIFTLVAMSMVLSTSTMAYFSINPGGNIILLPLVILVALVDRFYSYMDSNNARAALLRLAVTIGIAFVCIPVLISETIATLVLSYPEIHFLTAALVLMFSSYQGKKLTDYRYLKLLGENRKEKKSSTKSANAEKSDSVL